MWLMIGAGQRRHFVTANIKSGRSERRFHSVSIPEPSSLPPAAGLMGLADIARSAAGAFPGTAAEDDGDFLEEFFLATSHE